MTCSNETKPAGIRASSRLIAPAIMAILGATLAVTPVSVGVSGIVAQSALASSIDPVSPDQKSVDNSPKNSADKSSNDSVDHSGADDSSRGIDRSGSGADSSSGSSSHDSGNTGSNSSSHDSGVPARTAQITTAATEAVGRRAAITKLGVTGLKMHDRK